MKDKVADLVEMAKKMEKKTIENGDEIYMKIMAVDKNGVVTMVVMADWNPKSPEERNKILQGLGIRLREIVNLESLILISDTYFIKIPSKNLSEDEKKIQRDVDNGTTRLADLTTELQKYRREALMILTSQVKGNIVNQTMVPYKKVGNNVVFEDSPIEGAKNYVDNMLSNVWKGYLS